MFGWEEKLVNEKRNIFEVSGRTWPFTFRRIGVTDMHLLRKKNCPEFGYNKVSFCSQDSQTGPANGRFNTILMSCPVCIRSGLQREGSFKEQHKGQLRVAAVCCALFITCFIIVFPLFCSSKLSLFQPTWLYFYLFYPHTHTCPLAPR